MALINADRVWETSISSGSPWTLAGARTGYQAFSSVLATDDQTRVVVNDGVNWEVFRASYSGGVLTKQELYSSSNGGAPVASWLTGSKEIFLDVPADYFTKAMFGSTINKNLVYIGDSRIQIEYTPSAFGSYFSNAGMFTRANIRLNQAFNVVNAAGVSGDTTAGVLARIISDALVPNSGWLQQKRPSFVLMDQGGNDIVTSVPLATTMSNLTKTFDTVKSFGGISIYLSPFGFGQPYATMTQQQIQDFSDLWAWVRDLAATRNDLIVVSQQRFIADRTSLATSCSGAPDPDLVMDGLHQNAKGGGLIGENPLYTALKPFSDRLDRGIGINTMPDLSAGDLSNLIPNGYMIQGTGGTAGTGVTGTLPQGYFAQRGSGTIQAAASIVDRETVAFTFPGLFDDKMPGKIVKLDVSNASAVTDSINFGVLIGTTPGNGPYITQGEVGVLMDTGLLHNVGIVSTADDFSYGWSSCSQQNALSGLAWGMKTSFHQGIHRTPPFIIPVGKTQFYEVWGIQIEPGASGSVYFGFMEMRTLN